MLRLRSAVVISRAPRPAFVALERRSTPVPKAVVRLPNIQLNTKLSFKPLAVRHYSTAPAAAAEATTQAATSAADVASAAPSLDAIAPLSAMGPDSFVTNVLSIIHMSTGIPWWLELSAAAVVVRVVLLPFLITQVRNGAVLEILAPHVQRLTQKITEAKRQGRHAEALFHKEGLDTLYRGHNVSILRNFQLAMVNIPILFAFSYGIRLLTTYPNTLQTGGFGWITDLTVADPYHILPVLLVSLHLANIYMNRRIYKTNLSNWFKWLAISFAIPLGFVGWFAPAAYFCYWLPSALFTLVMNAVFLTRGGRRFFGVATAPLDIDAEDAVWKQSRAKIAAEMAEKRKAEEEMKKAAAPTNPVVSA